MRLLKNMVSQGWCSSHINRKENRAKNTQTLTCLAYVKIYISSYFKKLLLFFHFIYVFNVWWGTHAEVRGQFAGPGPLLPPAGSPGLSSGQRLGSSLFPMSPPRHLFALLTASHHKQTSEAIISDCCWGDGDTRSLHSLSHRAFYFLTRQLSRPRYPVIISFEKQSLWWAAESLISSSYRMRLISSAAVWFLSHGAVSWLKLRSCVMYAERWGSARLCALLLLKEWGLVGILLSETWGIFTSFLSSALSVPFCFNTGTAWLFGLEKMTIIPLKIYFIFETTLIKPKFSMIFWIHKTMNLNKPLGSESLFKNTRIHFF